LKKGNANLEDVKAVNGCYNIEIRIFYAGRGFFASIHQKVGSKIIAGKLVVKKLYKFKRQCCRGTPFIDIL
jgi:hypothetical protein